MRRSLKIGIGITGGLIALPLLVAFVLTVFFQDEIKERFEAALNAQLNTTIHLSGEASFSFFRYFPKAGISFQDVTIMGGPGFSSDTLLQAGRVAFLFNPFSLYQGEYEVETVWVSDGFVHLQESVSGANNYTIWSEDSTANTSASSSVELELADARMENMRVTYQVDKTDQWADIQVDQLQLAGAWTREEFTAQLKVEATAQQWREGTVLYAENLPIILDLATDVNFSEELYTLRSAEVVIADDRYTLKGAVKAIGKSWDTDIEVLGESVSLASMIAVMPPSVRSSLQGWDSEGQLNFATQIKGMYSQWESPAIQVEFKLTDGMITHPDLSRAITEVLLAGRFSNGAEHNAATSRLEIEEFTGKMDKDPIHLQIAVENLDDPQITLLADATLDISWWEGLLRPLGWESPEGRIALANIYLNGALKDWQAGRYPHRTQARGSITVAALAGKSGGKEWSIPLGQMALNQHTLSWEEVVLHTGSSDVTTTGQCNNLWTYLTQIAQSDTKAVLEVDATFTGEKLDWNDIMAFLPESEGIEWDEAANYLPYFQQYRGTIDLDFRSFTAAPFTAQNVKGRIRWSPYLTRLDGLSLETAGGTLQGDGFLRVINNQLVLEGQVLGRSVEVDELFIGFDNFWQDFIVADNLKGTVDGDFDCSVAWASDLSFVEEATSIQARLTVRDGELVDFEPMEDLSDFVKVKELRHIVFSELKNDIRVEGTTVILPAMQIKSTAMNLWISGTHTFDNAIDYQMQIDLLDIIARKIKLGKMKLEQAEQRADGLFNLYVTMTGTVDEPLFATDKATVLARFEASRSLLDPTFINFNEREGVVESRPFQPRDVKENELDFIDW